MNAMPERSSSAGRLAPRPFLWMAAGVYVAGFLSQVLISGPALAYGGLWAFAGAQAALLFAWHRLHVRRLRDAGRATGIAGGIALLCALSVLLLLLVVGFLQEMLPPDGGEGAGRLAVLFGLAVVMGMLLHAIDMGAAGLMLILLGLVALVPVMLAAGFSVWAATRPRAGGPAA